MRERPIIMKGHEVRAILAGQKTQTRRTCKPQPSARAISTAYDDSPMRAWWEDTGGDWAANPWVWVIGFKRVEAFNG